MSGSADSLGPIFFALSDPLRRRVLEAAIAHDGATVTQLCELFPVSRFAVMRHLNILEETGLIRREIRGRERNVYSTGLKFEDAIAAWARKMRERSALMPANKSLLEKLGFKPAMATRLDGVPISAEPLLKAARDAAGDSPVWLIGFAHDNGGILRLARDLIPAYPRGGHLWLCYPKKSGAIKSDLTRDFGWEPIFEKDLLAVTQISVDDTWSALRFRYRDEIKKLTRNWAIGG